MLIRKSEYVFYGGRSRERQRSKKSRKGLFVTVLMTKGALHTITNDAQIGNMGSNSSSSNSSR